MNTNSEKARVRAIGEEFRLRAVTHLREGSCALTRYGYTVEEIAQETRSAIADYLADTELDHPPLQTVPLRTL